MGARTHHLSNQCGDWPITFSSRHNYTPHFRPDPMKKTLIALLLAGSFIASDSSGATIPTFDPIADASSAGGTTYTFPGFLSHQTNAMGDQWYAINAGSSLANSNLATSVVITNVGLSYPG